MSEDSLTGWQDEVSELSWGEDVAGPSLEVGDLDVESRGDDGALVDSADEFNDDLLWSVVIDNLELSDVTMALHDSKELNDKVGDGSDEDLLLASSFSIDDCPEGVVENVDLNHFK